MSDNIYSSLAMFKRFYWLNHTLTRHIFGGSAYFTMSGGEPVRLLSTPSGGVVGGRIRTHDLLLLSHSPCWFDHWYLFRLSNKYLLLTPIHVDQLHEVYVYMYDWKWEIPHREKFHYNDNNKAGLYFREIYWSWQGCWTSTCICQFHTNYIGFLEDRSAMKVVPC